MKLSGLKYLTKQGFENVWKNRMMAFASFCVLLVSILLVGLSILFYVNINSIIGGIENKNEVIVFLDEDITQEEIAKTEALLERIENIDKITFYSKDKAFEDMKDSMSEYQEIFDSLGEDNPLVDSFRVKIDDISLTQETVDLIGDLDHVYSIRAPFDFVNILTEMRKIITLVATAIIIALTIVSMVIISNTTKASVFARRNEISIMKYVGATNMFIRIPFFVEGMVTGMASGLVAMIITWIGYDAVLKLLTEEVNILNIIGTGSVLPFGDIAVKVAVSYILAGAALGALGCVLSIRKHLNV
ncbi:MAG: permease-like cell division protein FtsX [Clostridium sp.]|nr:permease-like cell division protein FtsX [Clostridium sp.]MCM1546980.1 permease-like cell division protein FtsX [Ruminococcus sp.]